MEQRRKETFRRLRPSPYIKQLEGELPDSEQKDKYLRRLRNLKWLMIASRFGNMGSVGDIALMGLKNSYPEAYKGFERELRR